MSRLAQIRAHARPRDYALVAATLCACALGFWLVLRAQRTNTVHVVSTLGTALEVDIDGQRLSLWKNDQHQRMEVSAGVHRVLVLSGSERVDEATLLVEPHKDAVIFNVLGAAPVYEARVVYSSRPSDRDDGPAPTFYGGKRWFDLDDADYLFADPPSSISTKSSSETRHVVQLAEGGAFTTLGYLLGDGNRPADAVALTRTLVRNAALHGDDDALGTLQPLLYDEGPLAVLGVLREALRVAPDWYDAHRIQQNTLLTLGELEAARRYYAARAARDPSALNRVLEARIAPIERAQTIIDGLLDESERPDPVHVIGATIAMARGDYERAERVLAPVADSAEADSWVDDVARIWVVRGRRDDAKERVRAVVKRSPDLRYYAALVLARLEKLEPGGRMVESPKLLRQGDSGEDAAADAARDRIVLDVRSGLADPSVAVENGVDGELREVLRIERLAQFDPEGALQVLAKAAPELMRGLDDGAAMLLAAEAARTGQRELGERLLARRVRLSVSPAALLDFVSLGTPLDCPQRIELEHRAALVLVRARALEAAGQPADALYDQARTLDPLGGPATVAARVWPRPRAAETR